MGEIIAEVAAGFLVLFLGVFSIYQATRESFTSNTFHSFIGVSEKRQRAISLLVGVGSLSLALVFLIQCFGFLFGNTD